MALDPRQLRHSEGIAKQDAAAEPWGHAIEAALLERREINVICQLERVLTRLTP
jgi:hypothetical protein